MPRPAAETSEATLVPPSGTSRARHPLPPSGPVAPRRALLGGLGLGLLAIGAAACDAGDATPTGGLPGSPPTAPAVDADADLVASAGQLIADTAAVVAACARADRSLRPVARDLDRLHDSHLDELGWTGTATSSASPPRDRARARALEAENALHAGLLDAAVGASSGGLARLLAAMAAGVAQQQVRL